VGGQWIAVGCGRFGKQSFRHAESPHASGKGMPRGCRQPCTCIGFLLTESRLRVFLISLSADAKYEELLRSGSRSPISPHRMQSSRGSSTPAAAREIGSRESETSTNAQAFCRSVACARKEKARLVRPDDAGPHNSTRDPRGNPPPRTASSSVTPLGWSSTSERLWNPSRPRPTKASYLACFREGAIIAYWSSLFIRLCKFSSSTGKLSRDGEQGGNSQASRPEHLVKHAQSQVLTSQSVCERIQPLRAFLLEI
jgi:hypothetical protein